MRKEYYGLKPVRHSPFDMKEGKKRKIFVERIPGPFATLYEKAAVTALGTYYAPLAEEVVSGLGAGRILDLGTGPGYLPIEIVKRSAEIRVDGIDLSRRLIEIAISNASRAGLARQLHFEVGDASGLRFENGTYDLVISTGMFHSLKDPVRVLKECRRVLKRGGQAWIYDPAQAASLIDARRWKASFTAWERLMYLLFVPFAKINPGRSYNREEIGVMIDAAGFSKYEIQEQGDELKIKLQK